MSSSNKRSLDRAAGESKHTNVCLLLRTWEYESMAYIFNLMHSMLKHKTKVNFEEVWELGKEEEEENHLLMDLCAHPC